MVAVGAGPVFAGGGAVGGVTAAFLWQPEMPSMITKPALSSNELRYACFILFFSPATLNRPCPGQGVFSEKQGLRP